MRIENRGISYKWVVTIIVAIGTFMVTLDFGIFRIVLPHLSDVFQVDPNTVLWLTLIYLLISTGLMLVMGRVGDTIGRKKLFTSGLIIFSVGIGLSSIAQSFIQLLMFRAIQAVGAAMISANVSAILTASFPAEERGKALGIIEAVVGVGLLCGPAIGGLLLDIFDWHAIFYLRLPIGIIGAIVAWTLLKEPSIPKGNNKFDFVGATTIFIILASLLLFVNRGQSLGWTSPFVIGLGTIGIISFIVFLFAEKRVSQPIVDLNLYRIRLFRAASGSQILSFIGSGGLNFLMPFFLIQGLGFSSSKSGLILVTVPAIFAVISPFAGRLSDRVGTLSLCTFGLALASLGFFMMRSIGSDASVVSVVWRLFIIGIGLALFATPNYSAIMGSVPRERLGTASAMIATLRQIGMSTGIALAGTVFTASRLSSAAQLGSQGLKEEAVKELSTVNGFNSAILVAMIFAAIAAVISLLRGRRVISVQSQ